VWAGFFLLLPLLLLELLKARIRDGEEKARQQAVLTASELGVKCIEKLSEVADLISEVQLRLKDRKDDIRSAAMEGLAKIYKGVMNKVAEAEGSKKASKSKKKKKDAAEKRTSGDFTLTGQIGLMIGQIPSKIMECYFIPTVEDKYVMGM